MIYFRCERCAAAVRANDHQAGAIVDCPHCAHANACPDTTIGRSPLAPAPRTRRPAAARDPKLAAERTTASRGSLTTAGVAFGLAAAAAAFWLMPGGTAETPSALSAGRPGSAADRRQEEILAQAINQPTDPALAQLFSDINTRHFTGLLPSIPVTWEPRLVQVGPLADDTFTLEGMFGHIGEKTVILLNPTIADDPAALRRALSHEMVHAYLYTIGDRSTGHGPAFQIVLKRLADEGAFTGIVATHREREDLRAWLEQESTRLDADNARARRDSEDLAVEAQDLEQALADLNDATGRPPASSIESWTLRRDAYNRRVDDLRARAERARADLEVFNGQVARYNLMLSYPDGHDAPEATSSLK